MENVKQQSTTGSTALFTVSALVLSSYLFIFIFGGVATTLASVNNSICVTFQQIFLCNNGSYSYRAVWVLFYSCGKNVTDNYALKRSLLRNHSAYPISSLRYGKYWSHRIKVTTKMPVKWYSVIIVNLSLTVILGIYCGSNCTDMKYIAIAAFHWTRELVITRW